MRRTLTLKTWTKDEKAQKNIWPHFQLVCMLFDYYQKDVVFWQFMQLLDDSSNHVKSLYSSEWFPESIWKQPQQRYITWIKCGNIQVDIRQFHHFHEYILTRPYIFLSVMTIDRYHADLIVLFKENEFIYIFSLSESSYVESIDQIINLLFAIYKSNKSFSNLFQIRKSSTSLKNIAIDVELIHLITELFEGKKLSEKNNFYKEVCISLKTKMNKIYRIAIP